MLQAFLCTWYQALDADAGARWGALAVGCVNAPSLLVVRRVVEHDLPQASLDVRTRRLCN